MHLRLRDIPLYLFGLACWVCAVGCAGWLVLATFFAVTWDDWRGLMRYAWMPVATGTVAAGCGWRVARHFMNRVEPPEPESAPAVPGFEVLPPR
jgi:hypothetical protein